MKIRVILVDNHASTPIGMRHLLSAYDDLRTVAQAQDADGLLAQPGAHPCDPPTTDLMMPGSWQVDGLHLVQKVRRRYPDLSIIVVTTFGNPALVSSLLKLGIHGLVSKRGMLDDLPEAIRHTDRRLLISSSTVHLLEVDETEHGKPLTSLEQLTPCEAEVSRLHGSGLAVGEIAIRLLRSKQTISAQKSSAMCKLGLDSNVGFSIHVRKNGLA